MHPVPALPGDNRAINRRATWGPCTANRATRKHAVKRDEGENLAGKYSAEELFTDARA